MAGFIGAGTLIQQNFSSWRDNPISTTLNTNSISELNFPNVTVCPPKNRFTNLNPDLVMASSVVFDEKERKELSDFVADLVFDTKQDTSYDDFMAYKQESYRDWYTGTSYFYLGNLAGNQFLTQYQLGKG